MGRQPIYVFGQDINLDVYYPSWVLTLFEYIYLASFVQPYKENLEYGSTIPHLNREIKAQNQLYLFL